MLEDPSLPLFARGPKQYRDWPKALCPGRIEYLPLSHLLTMHHAVDAHLAAYSAPSVPHRLGTDPTSTDSDGDRLTDLDEFQAGTSPTASDSDSDGLDDGDERELGTDPTLADTDGDRLSDFDEFVHRTDPLNPDTDGDGLADDVDPDPLVPA